MKKKSRRVRVLAGIVATLALLLGGCGWWMFRMPGKSWTGPLPELDAEGRALRDRMRAHVEMLAGTIGPRNVFDRHGLDAAERYVSAKFRGIGYEVDRQEFLADGDPVANLEATLSGGDRKDEILVLGAHYDSIPDGPAADDNASAVAALLEIARALHGRTFPRTIRFVAFVNEEPPHFQKAEMGSLVYARRCRDREERVTAMVSLETIGYYRDEPGTQKYPPPLGLVYPDTGNFIAFVGNMASRPLVHRTLEVFREKARFPSVGGALPGWLPGIGWSDHWSFWQAGYPAVMVTDTAPFRNPNYHLRSDLPDTLDYDRMALVVEGVREVVEDLATR